MAAKTKAPEESEPSRAAGGCVLLVLAVVVVAGVFAASPAAGVLGLWIVGTVTLYRSVRRAANPAPPPLPTPPLGDVSAGGKERLARVEYDPSGGRCTLHVTRDEVNET